MTEETKKSYRQLDKDPNKKHLDPAVSEKGSAENTELMAMAERLRNPKDESEYYKDLQTLQSAAENGWPVAQLGLTNYFRDIGAFHAAQKWSDQLVNNKWVGKSLEADVGSTNKSHGSTEQADQKNDVNAMSVYLKTHEGEKDETYKEVTEYLMNKAHNGDALAQLEYGKLLQKENKPDEARQYFQKVLEHKDLDPQIRREAAQCLGQEDPVDKQFENDLRKMLSRNNYGSLNDAKVAAYKQAGTIVARQNRNEGYLPHHSFIPPKDED